MSMFNVERVACRDKKNKKLQNMKQEEQIRMQQIEARSQLC